MLEYRLTASALGRLAVGLILALALLRSSPVAAADFINHIGMAFVTVPPGSVLANGGEVSLSDPLQVGIVPVTGQQFGRFLAAQAKSRDKEGGDGAASPASGMSWVEAQAFVAWLNATKPPGDRGRYRLLSETEWEYAARAGGAGKYPWGDVVTKGLCPSCGGKFDPAAPAGRTKANRFGLRDMVGGNWEWTADCWPEPNTDADSPTDGSPMPGPEDCDRVLRGGRDLNLGPEPDDPLPANARDHADPFYGSDLLGFRVARVMPTDRRDPQRWEVGAVPDAGRFTPPPMAPVSLAERPTAEGVNAAIVVLAGSCGAGFTFGDRNPVSEIIGTFHPVFRGLPVVDWMYADGGEGSAWGPVFDASPQAVAAAIPEAAATAKFLHGPHEGRVERSLVELSASQTWLSCRQPNYLHYD